MTANITRRPSSVSLLQMSNAQAEKFFMKEESYCAFDLPEYFSFRRILDQTHQTLKNAPLSSLWKYEPAKEERVNHVILTNKDGKYAWRSMQLIHPAIYVSLLKTITETNSWGLLLKRFSRFSNNPKIRCLSIPAEVKGKGAAGQVSNWWQEVEQKSIELSLEYEYIARTDITDCYGAIYTHSIVWAIHGQKWAKKNRKTKCLGNDIDTHLRGMNFGQTNGIPQGSVLMNFIAEVILGYSDRLLSWKLHRHNINDYQILRFRDDYRIFVNHPKDGEDILKCLSETMHSLGMKLNPSKTGLSRDVIRQSIKPDKLSWICRKQTEVNLQKQLLIIHAFSHEHPNSGSLRKALQDVYKRIPSGKKKIANPLPLIGIVTDIAFHSPSVYPVTAGILSKLFDQIPASEKTALFMKIQTRLRRIPNSGFLEIWLQWISHANKIKTWFSEPLCKLIDDPKLAPDIWNIDWLSSKELIKSLSADGILKRQKLAKLSPVIPAKEFELFPIYPG